MKIIYHLNWGLIFKKMKTVGFHTFGCKLNFSETSSILREFTDNGYKNHIINGNQLYHARKEGNWNSDTVVYKIFSNCNFKIFHCDWSSSSSIFPSSKLLICSAKI